MGRDRHGSRAPAPHRNRGHRSRSVAALARRPAGAFLLALFATFALFAAAPAAEAQTPGAPTISLQVALDNRVQLRLDRPATHHGYARYQINYREKRTPPLGWLINRYFQPGSTNFPNITNLATGTVYEFRARLCSDSNGAGTNCGDWSDILEVTTTGVNQRDFQVTALVAAEGTDPKTQVDLSWTAPVDTNYRDYYWQSKLASASYSGTATHTTSTSAAVSGLTAGTEYDFRVRACRSASNTDGNCGAWTEVEHTTAPDIDVPDAVSDLKVTLSGTTATLTWTVPADGGSAFTELAMSVDTGDGFSIPGNGTVANPGTQSTLSRTSSSYNSLTKFRIRYANAVGHGEYSNVAMAGPGAPTGLMGRAFNITTDRLSWTAPADSGGSAITDYEYRRREIGTTNWGAWASLGTTGTTEVDAARPGTGADRHKGFEHQVRAVNSSGPGPASNTVAFGGRPTGLGSLTATQGSGVSVDLSWPAPTNTAGKPIAHYRVEWREDANGDWTGSRAADGFKEVTSGRSVTFTDADGLQPATTYNFRYLAHNGDRPSDYRPSDGRAEATTAAIPQLGKALAVEVRATAIGGFDVDGWHAVTHATGYTVQWKSGTQSYDSSRQMTTTSRSVEIRGVAEATEFTARVKATADGFLDGPWSDDATGFSGPAASIIGASSSTGQSTLTEPTLHGATVQVRILPSTVTWTSINASHFRVTGVPGATVTSVRLFTYNVQMTLAFSGDIDADADLGFAIAAAAHSGTTELTTINTWPVTAVVEPAPGRPGFVDAAPGDRRLTVTWGAAANADGYKVQWKSGSQSYDSSRQRVTTQAETDARSWTIHNLDNGTEYTVRVVATRDKAPDGAPEEATGTPVAPGTITDLAAAPGETHADLDWTAPADQAYRDYFWQRKLASAGFWSGAARHTRSTSPRVSGLTPGEEYDFRVRACRSASNTAENCGPWAETSARAVARPGRVTDLGITLSGTSVTLTWTIPANGGGAFTKLTVQHRLEDAGNWSTPASVSQQLETTATWSATNALYNAGTRFRIRYTNSAGDAEWSNVVMTGPGPPRNPGGTAINLTTDRLTWSAPADNGVSAVTGYQHRSRPVGGSWGAWTGSGGPPRNVNRANGAGTNRNNGFDHQVRARNASGGGAPSDTVRIGGRPSGLGALSASASGGSVRLSWPAPTNDAGKAIAHYLVEWREDATGDWSGSRAATGSKTVTAPATGVTLTQADGIALGTTYNFRYLAHNGDRPSDYTPGDGSVEAATASVFATASTEMALHQGNVFFATPIIVEVGGTTFTGSIQVVQFEVFDLQDITGSLAVSSSNLVRVNDNRVELRIQPGVNSFGANPSFRIRVKDSGHTGSGSIETNALQVLPRPPSKPGGLGSGATASQVSLRWNASSYGGSGALEYQVRHKKASDPNYGAPVTVPDRNDRFHRTEGLDHGTAYDFQVRACVVGVTPPHCGAWSDRLRKSTVSPPLPTAFATESPNEADPDVGGFTVTLGRALANGESVTLEWEVDADFPANNQTMDADDFNEDITFGPGGANRITIASGNRLAVPLTLRDDNHVEGGETAAIVTITALTFRPAGGASDGSDDVDIKDSLPPGRGAEDESLPPVRDRRYMMFVRDNDPGPNRYAVTVTPDEVAENAGPTEITVTIGYDTGTALFGIGNNANLVIGLDGDTATEGGANKDYDEVPDRTTSGGNPIPFQSFQSSVTYKFVLTPFDDDEGEGDEFITVEADNTNLGEGTARITILDDDISARISSPASVNEFDLDGARLTVALTGVAYVSGAPDRADFRLAGVPGLTVASVTGGNGANEAVLTLAHDRSVPGADIAADAVLTVTVDMDATTHGSDLAATVQAVANKPPAFAPGTPASLSVPENENTLYSIGDVIVATDPEGDAVTLSLEGGGAAFFDLAGAGGARQLRTKAHIDYETHTSFSLTVRAADEHGDSFTHTLTVNVQDRPDTGGDDSLTATSGADPAPAGGRRSVATYSIAITGLWDNTVTPNGVPTNSPHFTTFAGGVHSSGVSFLAPGQAANAGVEAVAETGATGALQTLVQAQVGTGNADRFVSLGAPGIKASRTHTGVTLTSDHPRITLLSMIAPTPDWFVGVAGLRLLKADGTWETTKTVDLYPWDAGTEKGDGFSLDNDPGGPPNVITSIRGRGQFTGKPIARIVFTRTGLQQAPPAPPGAAAASLDGGAQLSWTAPAANSGITKYQYRQKSGTANFGAWTDIPNSAAGSGTGSANNAGYTVTGLTNGTEYTFQIRAVNAIGEGAASADLATTPVGRPEAPADFTVTAVDQEANPKTVDITWTAPNDGGSPITAYQVGIREAGTSDEPIQGLPLTDDLTSPASGRDAGTLFVRTKDWEVFLRAHNAGGPGAWSAPFRVDRGPGQVETLTAEGGERISGVDDADTVRFQWTAPTTGGAVDTYEHRTDSGATPASQPANDLDHDATGAMASDLTFEVRGVTALGVLGDWRVLKVSRQPAKPGKPAGTVSTNSTDVALTWSAVAIAADLAPAPYRMQYRTGGGAWQDGGTAPRADSPTGTVTGLEASTPYEFRVRAETAHRDGAWSDVSDAVTTATVGAGIASTDPDPLTEAGLHGAELTVDLVGTRYEPSLTAAMFSVAATPEPPAGVLAVSGVSRTDDDTAVVTLSFTGNRPVLAAGDTEITVTVADTAHTGGGNLTTGAATVTGAAPDEPGNFRVTVVSTTSINVTWDTSAYAGRGLLSYTRSHRTPPGSGDWTGGGTGQGTIGSIGGLAPGTEYEIRVRACVGGVFPVNCSDYATFTHYTTGAELAATDPATLRETALGGAELTVDLVGGAEWVASPAANSVTVSGIDGVTVAGVARDASDPAQAAVTLAFDGADFDADGTLTVTVKGAGYTHLGGARGFQDLPAGTVSVTANNEATGTLTFNDATPEVGSVLTVSPSNIQDVDGPVPAVSTFTWQWYRVDTSTDPDTETPISGVTGTSYTPTDADRGSKLRVRAMFTDSAGNAETVAGELSDFVKEVLAPPGNFVAERSDGKVRLTWEAVPGATEYRITHDQTGGATPQRVFTPGSAPPTHYEWTGLDDATTYTFSITVLGNSEEYVASSAATVTAVPLPGAPTGVGVTAGTGDGFTLTWTAPAGTVDSYTWEHTPAPATAQSDWTEGGTGVTGAIVTATVANLATTATAFRVRGVNASGPGAPSAAVVLAAKPGAVIGLDADGHERLSDLADGIRLTWTAPLVDGIDNGADDISGYDVQWKSGTQSYDTSRQMQPTAAQADVTGLDDATDYDFRVRANNADRKGAWTEVAVSAVPASPGSVAAAAETTSTDVTVSWSAVTVGAGRSVTGYTVERGTSATGPWSAGETAGGGATSAVVRGLDPATTYHFRVRAETDHRDGTFSTPDNDSKATTATVGASILATDPVALTETNLDGAQLTVALTGATFSRTPVDGDFTLTTGITGLTLSVVSNTSTQAVLELAHTRTDFDNPETIAVTVAAAALTSGALTTGTVPVTPTAASEPTAAAELTVKADSRAVSAAEGGAATVTVELSAALPRDIKVEWSTADGTAVQPGDYPRRTHADTTLTIPAGDTTAQFTVQTAEDTTDEDDETFTVTVALESVPAILEGDVNLSGTAAELVSTVTITDDDDPPTLSITTPSVNEGDSGTATLTFTLTLSAASGKTVSVSARTDQDASQTATETADYTARGVTSIVFQPGETGKTFEVAAVGDNRVEEDETVSALFGTLSNTVIHPNHASAETGTGTGAYRLFGTITNDDTAPTTIALSVSPASVAEGDAETTVTVTAAFPDGSDVLEADTTFTVTVGTGVGDATFTDDYTLAGTVNRTFDMTIPAGAASGTATFKVTPVDDNAAEGDETVRLSVSAPPAGFTVAPATLTIADNDQSATITATSPTTLTEAAIRGGSATVTVDLAGGIEYVSSLLATSAHFELVTDPPTNALGISGVSRDANNTRAVLTLEVPAGRDLTADTDLSVRVKGAAWGGSADLTTGTKRVTQIPAAGKAGNVALIPGNGQLGVTWTAAANADGYKVQWKSGSQTFDSSRENRPTNPGTSQSPHVITGLTDGTEYTVQVIATRTNAPDGAASDPATKTTSPAQVAGVNAAPGTRAGVLDVTWTAALRATGYKVQWKQASATGYDPAETDPAVGGEAAVSGRTTVSHTLTGLTGLTGGGAYDVRVVAVLTDAPDGPPSAADRATPLPAPSALVVSLSPASVDETDAATTVNVTVAFNAGAGALASSTAVTVAIGGGNAPNEAVEGTDYPNVADITFTIPADTASASGSFSIDPTDDSRSEGTLAVTVRATATVAGSAIEGAAALAIVDDDIPPTTATLALAPASIAEGRTSTLTVTLGGRTTTGTTTVTPTPPPGGEYTVSHSGSRTIPPGGTSTTFTLTAADDETDAPDRRVSVAVATASGTGDAVQTPAPVELTITDDDPAPVATLALSPATVTEGSATNAVSTVTAVLDRPSSEETTLRVSTTTPAAVDPAEDGDFEQTGNRLTIAAGETTSTGTVRLEALDDDDSADERVTVSATAVNNQGLTGPAPVTLRIDDDDTPGVTVAADDPLAVTEGASATYTVVLNFQPSGDVAVRATAGAGVAVGAAAESAGVTHTLTFTADNWNSAQTVTVVGVEDDDAADRTATITHRIVQSATVREYDAVSVGSVTVAVDDDETAGFTLSETAVTVNETETATYTAVLDVQPTSTVRLDLTSADTSAVTVSPPSLTFSRSNWSTPRTVTVRGVDDTDGEHETVDLTHAVDAARSADEFDAVADATVTVTTVDDDLPGVRVSVDRLDMDEGRSRTYTLRLNTRPAGDVVIDLATAAGSSADVSVDADAQMPGDQRSVTFTADNWNRARTVTVRAAEDDDAADDTATIAHTIDQGRTADGDYDALTGLGSVAVGVEDDETAGIALSALAPSTVEENGSARYTVALEAQPTSGVVIDITSDNADVTVQPARLTFTTSNWSAARTVTVSAGDDPTSDDETATLSHATLDASSADEYDALSATLAVRVIDDDVPGLALSASSLTVDEDAEATYTVALQVRPSAAVVVEVTSDDPEVGVTPSRLVFTVSNWNAARTVTVRAAADGDTDDDTATLRHRIVDRQSAAEFRAVADESLAVTVDDDDLSVRRSIRLAPTRVSEGAGAVDVEVTVDLGERLTGWVYTLQATESEGTATRGSDFTGAAYVERAVPVREDGVFTHRLRLALLDDAAPESDETVVLRLQGVGPGRSVIEFTLEAVLTIVDDDVPGVALERRALEVREGGSARYTLRLNTQPSGDVVIDVDTAAGSSPEVSVDTDEGSDGEQDRLTFTRDNWNAAQAVTVSAARDGDAVDDEATLTHEIDALRTADTAYRSVDIPSVAVRVIDDTPPPPAGVEASPASATSLQVRWPAHDDATGYRIEWTAAQASKAASRKTSHSSTTLPPEQTSYTITGLVTGTRYTVTVTALVGGGDEQVGQATGTPRQASLPPLPPLAGAGLGVGDASAVEGEAVTFTVTVSGAGLGRALELVATPSSGPDDTATAGADYSSAPRSVRLAPGQTAATFTVATVEDNEAEPDETFTVRLSPRPGTSLPFGVRIAQATATGTIVEAGPAVHRLPLVISASHPLGRQSFVRVINRSDEAGEVRIEAYDDEGVPAGPVTLLIGAGEAAHFNSDDLEEGNAAKGLSGGIGTGAGHWRLALTSELDLGVTGYLRTEDGFVTAMHDLAPRTEAGQDIVFFNPASNRNQVSRLRLINRGEESVEVTIEGVDDDGESPGTAVKLPVPARGARTVTAQELESEAERGEALRDLSGALGDGAGKWRLRVSADAPVAVMSLLASPTGHLTNLSTAPGGRVADDEAGMVHHVPWFAPAAHPLVRESFVRVINRSDESGEVRIDAFDDEGAQHGPLTLHIGANEAVHLNSDDLEEGNAAKGLDGSTGEGEGRWRLALTSDLDLEVLGYLRTDDGFVTSMHDLVPRTGAGHDIVFFNPGGNTRQVSRLRLINRGSESAEVTIEGIDDDGESPGTAVRLSVPAHGARTVTAQDLESEAARGEALRDLSGALGDGAGKWRLRLSADRPVEVMSLLASPTGHLTNLSTAPPPLRAAPPPAP